MKTRLDPLADGIEVKIVYMERFMEQTYDLPPLFWLMGCRQFNVS